MAPSKKSKISNRRYSSIQDISPDKDAGNPNKSKQRKKLSDKLGSQWTKAELERFYDAYRKYGKDWKKVASVLRSRSVEMVEALYNMNRAYLSLPEGTASVVGLIAMMTDHYNVLEGSESERESNDASEIPRRALSRKRPRVQLGSSKEDSFYPPSKPSSEGCLSLLKMAGLHSTHPHAVRKRTPRVPVSNSNRRDSIESYTPPNKRGRRSEVDSTDDVVAALALTEALQRTDQTKPTQNWDRMFPQSGSSKAKHSDAFSDDWTEVDKEHGGITRGKNTASLVDMEGVGTVEVHQKGKKFYRKQVNVDEMRNSLSDDSGEACSGTEEGLKGSAQKGKRDIEVSSSKAEQFLPRSQRKRSKKLFFGDESPGLDALNTLANLSTLMLPTSTMESESSAQFKDDRATLEIDEQSGVPEVTQHRNKIKQLGLREKPVKINRFEDAPSRKSKLERYPTTNKKAVSKIKQQPEPLNNMWKKKRKSSLSKVPDGEPSVDSHSSKSGTNQEASEEANKHISKAAEVSVGLPTKHQNRRKMNLKRVLASKVVKSSGNLMKNQKKQSVMQQEKSSLEERKLSSCLSSNLARRWCSFEWFYSAIDYPWFAKREFVEYLNHVGLGHIPRLTRVEWGVIRSSLGKPRRFSERFLLEERDKLKQYRESVREHYTELRTGVRDGLPTDLARPLTVGQRVVAIHPKTREVHDGKVLTVDKDKCRVQFDRVELGAEIVMDVDCMPLNPLDNMPETLRRQKLAMDKSNLASKGSQVNGHPSALGPMFFSPSAHLENANSPFNAAVTQAQMEANRNLFQARAAASDMAKQAAYGQPFTMAHIQGRDADIQAMSELHSALQKKDAILAELRNTNNDIRENHVDLESTLKDSEHFKKHIATASNALLHLRQRNTYPSNSLPPWINPRAHPNFSNGLRPVDSLVLQELGSGVIETVKGLRVTAQSMVDAAIKAVSSVKEGEDPYPRIREAVDSVDKQPLTSDIRAPAVKSSEQVNGTQQQQNQLANNTPELPLAGAADKKPHDASDTAEAKHPLELIKSCVATMLIIQTCTGRQHPPTDVAQMIDSAVTSLQPCCPQNLPLYREIQMCMGRLKTQILALIPT